MNNRRVARHIDTRPKEWGCRKVGKAFVVARFSRWYAPFRAFRHQQEALVSISLSRLMRVNKATVATPLSYGDRVGGLQVDSGRQREGGAV